MLVLLVSCECPGRGLELDIVGNVVDIIGRVWLILGVAKDEGRPLNEVGCDVGGGGENRECLPRDVIHSLGISMLLRFDS